MTQHQSRLLIIDGLNLIRRLFAVHQSRSTDQQALGLGMQQALRSSVRDLLKRLQPSHVIAVFDSERQGWRYRSFPDYKRSRKPMPTDLKLMLDDLQEILWQSGVDSLLSEDEEADDLIAAIACKSSPHLEVVVASTDHGFFQLLSDGNIHQWHPFERHYLDSAFYYKKYGIGPNQWCDYQALVGDKTNDVPGAPGIGKKTAQKALEEHGSLQHLFANSTLPTKLANSLGNNKAQVLQAKQLATLRCDIELGFSLKEIRLTKR